jgi:hypothetical protein
VVPPARITRLARSEGISAQVELALYWLLAAECKPFEAATVHLAALDERMQLLGAGAENGLQGHDRGFRARRLRDHRLRALETSSLRQLGLVRSSVR